MKKLLTNQTFWIVFLIVALILSFALKSEAQQQSYI